MKKLTSVSIHEAAPELLLDKIAQLNGIYVKHKAKDPSSKQLPFYEDLLRVMRFAFSFMMDTKYIHEKNIMLESNVRFLSDLNHNLQKRLDEITTVQRLQCQGRLEEVIEQAQKHTEYTLSLRKNANK